MLKKAAVALVAVASAASAASCSARSGSTAEHQTYVYTCCLASDISRPLHPGGTLVLHWIVKPGPVSDQPSAAKVTLRASLSGSYKSVAALKSAGVSHEGTAMSTARPVMVTNWVHGHPVSRIAIPASATAGWYNLRFSVASAGTSFGGASIVRVTAGQDQGLP